jgi:hypothetical protein
MWSGYMNVVCKFADGSLGYSPLAGSPFSGEMVVIDIEAFGLGAGCTGYVPSSPYNLGRTLTHELGHFFNLEHTFDGCNTTSNCQVQGDYICDTPASDDATGGCPAVGSITNCGVKTLTMNYMDYTNDACMYMFTQGQANVMQAHYNAIASEFKPNVLANNVFLENTFSITPNPNNGEFNIRLKEVLSNYEIEIYDSLGRNVYEKQFLNNQNLENEISLKGNPAGLYFVSIKSEDAIITKKILIY